jgi:hypothetical protein
LDIDDSTAPEIHFLLDSLCGYDGLLLSDIDIEIRNEYPVDSLVIEVLTGVNTAITIPNGNYILTNKSTKVIIQNNGTTTHQEIESAIINGYLDNISQLAEVELQFTVWYDSIAGHPAIATLLLASPLPYAGDDLSLVYCEGDENLTLDNIPSSGADTGGLFYDQDHNNIASFPSYQAPDTVMIYYETTNGICYDTSNVEVIINKLPNLEPITDYTICAEEELNIKVALEDDVSIIWSDGSTSNERSINKSGQYIYTIKNDNGCTGTDSFEVVFRAEPQSQPVEAKVCEGETFQFMGKIYTQEGNYKDTLQSSQDCDSIIFDISFDLFNREKIEVEGDLGICEEESIEIEVVSPHINLQLNGEETINRIMVIESGSYMISGYDMNGCYEELTLDIINYPTPQVETMDLIDTTFHDGIQLPVKYQGDIDDYYWTPSSILDCDDCPYPNLLEAIDGIYMIQVVNIFGCTAIDTIRISFKTSKVYLPNIISTNVENSINNILFLQGNINTQYDLQIYDRWGGLIYNKSNLDINNSTQGWQPSASILPGVYVYKISYMENGKKEIIVNDITVIR